MVQLKGGSSQKGEHSMNKCTGREGIETLETGFSAKTSTLSNCP